MSANWTPLKPSRRLAHTLCLIGILAGTYIAYARTLRFGFAYDDFLQIVYNKQIESTRFLPGYFTNQVWAQAGGMPANLYRPLFMSWLLLNREIFGLDPTGWHLTTILVHLLATLLVFLAGKKLLRDPGPALFAAGLFGLHPVHVEAVAWVSAVTEPLAAVFFLSSLVSYFHYRDGNHRKTWLLLSLLSFAAAMMVKETATILPGVIAGYEFCFPQNTEDRGRRTLRSRMRSFAILITPYCLLLIAYLGARITVLHGFAHRISMVPTWSSVLTWPWLVQFYLGILLFPAGLGPFYDVEYIRNLSFSHLIVPVVLLLVAGILIWRWSWRSGSRLPLFFSIVFVLTLAPILVSFVIMSRWEGAHDRYLYLPSVALAFFTGYGVQALGLRTHRQLIAGVGILLLAGMGALTWQQTQYWQNDLVLFVRGVAVAPNNIMARLNLSAEMTRRHDLERAFALSQEAVQLDPQSGLALRMAGEAAFLLGNYSAAENYYLRALAIEQAQADQLYYLGLARIRMGRYTEGLVVIQKAIDLWPSAPRLHYALGLGLEGLGNWTGACEAFRAELAIVPDSPAVRNQLSEAEVRELSQKRAPRLPAAVSAH
jgi:cytochrome c-type biogenesis protein CcmH/NrfG